MVIRIVNYENHTEFRSLADQIIMSTLENVDFLPHTAGRILRILVHTRKIILSFIDGLSMLHATRNLERNIYMLFVFQYPLARISYVLIHFLLEI